MSKRDAFVEAACKENVKDFLQLVQLHEDRTEPYDIQEVLEEMSLCQRETLWGKLATLLRDVLQEVPPERWEESTDDTKHVMAVTAGVTLVATISLKVLENGNTYNELLNIAHLLHVVLVSLPLMEAPVILQIHTLCEAWWTKDLLDKDKIGRTAFVIALEKIFHLKKPFTELQRAWSLHKVLLNVDYASEDGWKMAELLVQFFQHPSFIRNDDGKRIMVFLFSWHVDFIPVIHGTIKNQLQFFNTMTVEHVAEIYFRAWKKTSGTFLEKIENECIQDFMMCAMLLQRSSPVHRRVLQILYYFHNKKVYRPAAKMLCVLYKPILWKYLNVPNFEVRANATLLFADVFPLIDPDQEVDGALQKQLDTLMVLLFDTNHCVRCNAIQGVCKILDRSWELLPSTVIGDFMKKLKELASDSSSDDVRSAVFTYLCIVLNNVLSHPLMEKLAPRFKYSLHDTSAKVRVAFVDMLLKLKAVRAAKFWHVCSLDHLVVRLACDTPHVSKRLAELLFDSFFPANATEREWCTRCINLIQMNPIAARKFYLYAHLHTSPSNIVKLMLAIRCVLNLSILRNGDATEFNESNKENSASENPLVLEKDVVASLLEVVAILWKNVDKSLQQSDEIQKRLNAKFSCVMSKYFSVFTDQRCQAPLMIIASFMPANAVATFSYSVLSRLSKIEPGDPPSSFGQLLDCMCSWGKTAGVLEIIIDWLSEALPENQALDPKRKVTIQVTAEAKPDLALVYLDYLFLHKSTRNKVLALGPGPLKRLHAILGNWKSLLHSHLSSSSEGAASSDLALKAFTFHHRLSVHLQHHFSDDREYLQSLGQAAMWVGVKVLPFMADGDQGDSDATAASSRELAAEIIKAFLAMCSDVVLCLDDSAFKDHALHLCLLVVLSEKGYLCIPAVLAVLKELAPSYSQIKHKPAGDEQDGATKCLAMVANIFQKIIEHLARRVKKEPEEGQRLCQSALSELANFLLVAQACNISGVFDTLFAFVIVETRYVLQKMTHPEEVITPQNVEDLPPLSSILLSVILKSPLLTRAFSVEVLSSLNSNAFGTLTELAAVVRLLAVLQHEGQSNVCLKRAAIIVQQQIQAHANAEGDIQGVIFQSSVATLNEVLTHWVD